MTTSTLHKYSVITSSYKKAQPIEEHFVMADYASVTEEYGCLKFYIYDDFAPGGSRIVKAFSSWESMEDLTAREKTSV